MDIIDDQRIDICSRSLHPGDLLNDDINFDCDVTRRGLDRPNRSLPYTECPNTTSGTRLNSEWLIHKLADVS